jgi:outer membrane protein assembly factor BamB
MKSITLAAVLLAAAGSVCAADQLIVTGLSGIVQTIDLDNGEVGHLGVCTGAVNSMAVADGTLYLGGFFGDLYEFDLATNQVVNTLQIPGEAHAMAWDGTSLLIANGPSTLISVDPVDGAVTQTRNIPTSDISAVGIDAGGLFVGGQNSLALRSHLGSNNFQFFAACGSQIRAMGFGPDTMYLAGADFSGSGTGTVYKFDKFVGGVNYSGTFDTPHVPTAVLAHAGLLYVGGQDGMVHEMDPADGTILRSFDLFVEVRGIAPTTGLVSCPADYDISGSLNFFDVAQFMDLFAARLPAGDANGDGLHDFFDVQSFLSVFNAGCP